MSVASRRAVPCLNNTTKDRIEVPREISDMGAEQVDEVWILEDKLTVTDQPKVVERTETVEGGSTRLGQSVRLSGNQTAAFSGHVMAVRE